MHELSVIENLKMLLKKICQEQKAIRVITIELAIHPYSCLDEGNLNFIFSSMFENDPLLKDARIKIRRSNQIEEREYIVDNVEIEVE